MILPAFSAYGIEIEYMIVDRNSLNVMACSDEVLKSIAGEYTNEVEQGPIAYSNEVVLHVIELKTNGPVSTIHGRTDEFLQGVRHISGLLADRNGILMPTAMHPWMNPHTETRLWSHDSWEIYDTYNRIFNCSGHGWSNLQSMHINLPFEDDEEFAKLHTAIRTLLPIMPALAASSPLMDAELTGLMDTRLETYRKNADIIPSITGLVIPEPVRNEQEYVKTILQPMYRDIAPYDPEKILQDEWLNSRGAIARFDRNTIEIRVLDTQETPRADLAIAALIIEVLRKLYDGAWANLTQQLEPDTHTLAGIFIDAVRYGDESIINDQEFLSLFNFPDRRGETRELWMYLYESVRDSLQTYYPELIKTVEFIITNGPLARRISRPMYRGVKRGVLHETYRILTECLETDRLFEGI